MFPQQNKPQQSDQNQRNPNQNNKPRISPFWWLVFLALLIWNIIAFIPHGNSAAQIPYSTFLEQVKSGNVTSVQISGDQISGNFARPFTWSAAGTALPPASTGVPSTGNSATQATATYTTFQTLFPSSVGDNALMPLLQQKNVVVNVAPAPTPWFTILLNDALPLLLLVVVFGWLGLQMSRSQGRINAFGRSRAKRYDSERTEVTFNDVAGEDEAKNDLKEVVDFLRSPKKYHDIGARIPRGVLLVGPPGTGKPLLARAVAGEANVPFFSLSASEFVEMFVGVGASRVCDLFQNAKENSPSIVFIDELDAVGRRRGAGLGTVNDEREQTLNQLLVEMDGFNERQEVIVLAATNRPDVLDPALLRPGRFDRQVVVGLPDRQGREEILKIHTREIRLSSDVKFDVLAQATIGMNGADLANLCNEAALVAARDNHKQVTMEDFEQALDKIMIGAERPVVMDAQARKVVAYHEAGHTVVAWYTPHSDPVHKVTIVPHGKALGVTEQLPAEDVYNYPRSVLVAKLTVMFGGRSAEEVALNEITTGAENDIIQATRLARRMVSRWAMSGMGSVAFNTDDEQPFLGYEISQGKEYSEATAALIDKEVANLLDSCHQEALDLLQRRRDRLDELATALLEHETVGQEELVEILGARESEAVLEGK